MEPGDITSELLALRRGDDAARQRLFVSVYEEMKSLARRQLGLRGRTPTLGATALVHEAYLRLVDQTRVDWNDRGHFFAVAARAMRQIAIDHARAKGAEKRGGERARVPLEDGHVVDDAPVVDVLAVHAALETIAQTSPRLVQVVEMMWFAGLSVEETAEALATSPSTVKRDWRKARAILQAMLSPGDDASR